MRLILKPLQWIYSVYAFVLFVVIMFLIFPFVFVASFLGRIKGGNIIIRLCMFWADCWFPLIFIWPKRYYEAPHDKRKPYIFISNHISFIDAAVVVKAFRQPIRPLGKIEMGKVPVFGFIYDKAIVSVDRGDADNRANSIRLLKSIINRGICVMVFPEGTFNMTNKPLKNFYDGAFRVAIETQTPIKPVLFLDTYDRMHYRSLFSLSPGKCRIIYLEEISVEGLTSDDLAQLKEKVFVLMEDKLKEYKATWITPTALKGE